MASDSICHLCGRYMLNGTRARHGDRVVHATCLSREVDVDCSDCSAETKGVCLRCGKVSEGAGYTLITAKRLDALEVEVKRLRDEVLRLKAPYTYQPLPDGACMGFSELTGNT